MTEPSCKLATNFNGNRDKVCEYPWKIEVHCQIDKCRRFCSKLPIIRLESECFRLSNLSNRPLVVIIIEKKCLTIPLLVIIILQRNYRKYIIGRFKLE